MREPSNEQFVAAPVENVAVAAAVTAILTPLAAVAAGARPDVRRMLGAWYNRRRCHRFTCVLLLLLLLLLQLLLLLVAACASSSAIASTIFPRV